MDQNFNAQIYREDGYLLIIFIIMAITIVVKSYFDPNGYLTPDSASYLQLAENLLEGKGYYVSAHSITSQNREFFTIWPVGYPTFIFLLAKLTGLSVFWASKFLNIILIGIILGIFRSLFRSNAYLYALIFLFASYIGIFSYTWSESLFITALTWFATSIYLFIVNSKHITLLYFSIMLSSLLLFMSRYIGAYSFGLIGLLGLYYGIVKKEKTKAVILISIAIVNITIMFLYLYHNYIETGFPTGTPRIPSSESNSELFFMLLKAMIVETLIPIHSIKIKAVVMVFFVQFSVLGFLVWKYRNNIIQSNNNTSPKSITLSYIFGVIGLVYLFFIILMRWIFQFDEYGYRFLAPGSFLLFIALIYFIQQRGTKQFFDAVKVFLLIFVLISYLINVPYKMWRSSKQHLTYYETLDTLKQRYGGIEKDSIIVFAPMHILYLYPEMQTRYSYKETWSELMRRIASVHKHVYMYVPEEELSNKRVDQSVINFVKKYDKGALVKIK